MSSKLTDRFPKLSELFGIDLRTLGLFRAALGSVMVWTLCRIYPDITAFYSDLGVMPRAWAIEADSSDRISLYFINGSSWFTGVMLTIQVTFALMYALGWRTRLANIVSFVMWASLCNRNGLVLIGGDLLTCCLLFWSMFLPVGARFSLDASRAANPPPQKNLHLSWASLGLLLQVMSVYFFSAILKSDPEWYPKYEGVYYALQLDRYATPLGQWLLNFPLLLKALSAFVWWLELLGPILIFSPVFSRPLRLLLMLAFMAMHVGFIFCLEIGHFPYVSICSLSTFLGGWVWDWLENRRKRSFTPAANPLGGPEIQWEVSRAWQRVAGVFALTLLCWNLAGINVLPRPIVFGTFSPILRMLRVDQYWNMFAPSPLREDGWMVIPARLADGSEIDLLHPDRGAPVYDKPFHYSQTHENIRWNTYRGRLFEREFAGHRQYYAKYLCRSWNRDKVGNSPLRDKRLMSFKIIYMVEPTLPDYQTPTVSKVELWEHYCFPRSAPETVEKPGTSAESRL